MSDPLYYGLKSLTSLSAAATDRTSRIASVSSGMMCNEMVHHVLVTSAQIYRMLVLVQRLDALIDSRKCMVQMKPRSPDTSTPPDMIRPFPFPHRNQHLVRYIPIECSQSPVRHPSRS